MFLHVVLFGDCVGTHLGVVVVPVPGAVVSLPAEDVPVVREYGAPLLRGVRRDLTRQAEGRGQALVGPELRQVGQLSILTGAGLYISLLQLLTTTST